MTAYLLVCASLGTFAVFHGFSAREAVKAAVCARSGLSYAGFAGLRALLSLALLILSLYVLFRLAGETPELFPPLKGVPAILPALFAFWIAGMALGQVGKSGRLPQFFGFQEYPKLFIFTKAFALCRHPMYSAWLIASWGLLVSLPYALSVFYNLLLTAFVVFNALQEERRMIALFGDRYRAYQKQIPFLLPYGFLKPQIRKDGAPRL